MPLIGLKCEDFKCTGTPVKYSSFLENVLECTGETDYLRMDFVTFCEWLGYLCNANGRCHYVHEAEVNQVSATAYADDPAIQVTLRLPSALNC